MINTFEEQLHDIVDEHESSGKQYDEFQLRNLQTRCIAAIVRVAGRDSVYFEKIQEIEEYDNWLENKVSEQVAVADALLSDIRKGYLKSLEEIIRANLFADYLEKWQPTLKKAGTRTRQPC